MKEHPKDCICHLCLPATDTKGYVHPKTIEEFEKIYGQEYEQELAFCDQWIDWATQRHDGYGVNFHQGRRSALVFNHIKMHQLIRILKGEKPNV